MYYQHPIKYIQKYQSTFCWVDAEEINLQKKYILSSGQFESITKITSIDQVLDIETLQPNDTLKEVKLNTLGNWSLKLAKEFYADTFFDSRNTGRYILIDPQSNNTVAVGFIN